MIFSNDIDPLLCDPDSGACALPEQNQINPEPIIDINKHLLKAVYFTDPICSSCWGIEPQLKKLSLQYGHILDMEYKMGGLLPDWSYNSGGISKPEDVAKHWDEMSQYYQMPINGDVWLIDPLESSFPPSIAFKAAQLQDETKALLFLRKMREAVFLNNKNIAKWDNIRTIAEDIGLDVLQLQQDYNERAKTDFQNDLKLRDNMGVRGFPTIIFTNNQGAHVRVYGSKPYEQYENAIQSLLPSAKAQKYDTSWRPLFNHFQTLTIKEYALLTFQSYKFAANELLKLELNKQIDMQKTKNGILYIRRQFL